MGLPCRRMLAFMNAVPQPRASSQVSAVLKAAEALGILGGGGVSAPRTLAALCNPAASVEEVSVLVMQEPGLAARVLKVANSAFYGVRRNVGSLDRALVVLGFDAVRKIAAAACLDRTMLRPAESALLQREALVNHSLATALAAESIARCVRRELAAEAFMGGLLHNLGVPVQMLMNPGGMRSLLDAVTAAGPEPDIRALEAQAGLIGHEACAAIVFESWRLPPTLINVAACHHRPDGAPAPYRAPAWLVHLGLQLAQGAGFGFPLEPVHASRSAAGMALLGVDDAKLDDLQRLLPERVAQMQGALAD